MRAKIVYEAYRAGAKARKGLGQVGGLALGRILDLSAGKGYGDLEA